MAGVFSIGEGEEMIDEWIKEEFGWYIHPTYGGLCRAEDGWYFYSRKTEDEVGVGPYKTLKEAKINSELSNQVASQKIVDKT